MLNSTSQPAVAKNEITLTNFGEFCLDYISGEYPLTISVKSFKSYNIISAENIPEFASRVFVSLANLMELRQQHRRDSTYEQELRIAQSLVKQDLEIWFKSVGTRKPKKEGDALRPCYGITYSDYAIFFQILLESLRACDNNIPKSQNKFLELLIISTANLLKGNPLSLPTPEQITISKTTMNFIKAEKSK